MRLENELKSGVNPEIPEKSCVWRIFKPKIDLKKCGKHMACVIFCPHNCISVDKKGYPVIDYNICTGCLICLRECPSIAISEEREGK